MKWSDSHVSRVFTVLAASCCIAVGAPTTAAADPPTKTCGTVEKASKTFRLRAANMSCKFARSLLRAPTDSSARVKGHPSYHHTASDCEGIIWRDHEESYSQEHNGKLPRDGKFVRYVVSRGCVG